MFVVGQARRLLLAIVLASTVAGTIGVTSAQAFTCQNRTFYIESLYSGYTVSAELGAAPYTGAYAGLLRARATAVGPWERFSMVCTGSGQFAIKAYNGRYVSAELGYSTSDWRYGMLRARATAIGPWEKFTYDGSDWTYPGYLKSVGNGRYVSSEFGYSGSDWRFGMLRARSTARGAWEWMNLTPWVL